MAFKNIISFIITTFFCPNKGTTTKASLPRQAGFECAVCLSTLAAGETDTRVLPCQHEFHGVCVDRWLSVPHFKNTCPICRFSMEEDCIRVGDRDQSRRQECFFTEEMVIWFSSFHVAGF